MPQSMHAEPGPIPRQVILTLACDGDHGLFEAPTGKFDVTDSDPRRPAVAAGWHIVADGKVYCPECGRRA